MQHLLLWPIGRHGCLKRHTHFVHREVRRNDSILFSSGGRHQVACDTDKALSQDNFLYCYYLQILKDTALGTQWLVAEGYDLPYSFGLVKSVPTILGRVYETSDYFYYGGKRGKRSDLIFHSNEGQEKSEESCFSKLMRWFIIYYCSCYIWSIYLDYLHS